MKSSSIFTVNLRDAAKGLLTAVLAAVLLTMYNTVNAGSFSFDWNEVAKVASTTGFAYLIKNFFTPQQTVIKNP